jgi:hypothetical protein
MMPPPGLETCVAWEKKVVKPAPPLVVDAGTKLGPNMPPPLTRILVELPEMSVVVAPLTMVVTRSVVMVTGRAVGGCCTMVWAMVRVQDHEVAYTAHQKLEEADTRYQLQCTVPPASVEFADTYVSKTPPSAVSVSKPGVETETPA